MITLIRMIRLKQLKIKWELTIMQLVDKQLRKFIKNPKELENKIISSIAELIHESNNTKSEN